MTSAELLARALCRHAPAPPSVAVLIGGLARGFTKPERWRSLRTNVLESLGAPVELLLYLKEFREPGPPSAKWRPPASSTQNASWEPDGDGALDAAIAELRPTMVRVDRDGGTEARLRSQYNRTCVARSSRHATDSKASLGPVDRPLQPMGMQMGYWHTMKRLWAMMCEREAARTLRFDRVMYARPDLVHYLGMGPYCLYQPATVYHSIGDDCGEHWKRSTPRFAQICRQVGGSDFWWLGPRNYAEFVASTLDRLLSCHTFLGMNEELFPSEGARFAREAGLTFVRSGGLLGASFIQRAAAPALVVQGVGSAVKDVASHIELLQLMYNESRPLKLPRHAAAASTHTARGKGNRRAASSEVE